MFYFLYGPDTFRSRAKLVAITKKFVDASPGLAPESFSASTLTPHQLAEILSPSLFVSKRLVVIEGILSAASIEVREELEKHLVDFSEDIVLVLRETEEVDAKSTLFKMLNQPGHAQRFDLLSPPAVVRWVVETAHSQRMSISDEAAKHLSAVCDFDCWRISTELAKLSALRSETPITVAQINELVSRSLTVKAFDLLDKVSAGDLAGVNQLTNRLLAMGEDPLRLLGLLAYHLRTLVRVSDANAAGLSRPAIIQTTKLHPFVVQKTLAQIGRMPRAFLVAAYAQIADTDWQIKSGELSPADGLNRLVTRLANRV